jgi:hypothetical protein
VLGWLQILAEQYPRGHREFKGSFFDMHGPADTMSWFTDHGVALKVVSETACITLRQSSCTCYLFLYTHRLRRMEECFPPATARLQ